MDRRPPKIVSFTIDQNMAYLIQQVTNEPTQDILAYFYGIAQYVAEDAVKTSKARRLSKEIVLFYKETAVPYKMQVFRSWWKDSEQMSHQSIHVSIYFPKKASQQDVSALISNIVEAGLGLSDVVDLPKFEKPLLKSPKCLRDVRLKQHGSKK